MRQLLFLLMILPAFSFAQSLELNGGQGGLFSLGVRSTFSTFNGHANESMGYGLGGQFRIQFADRVNSDWFFDYLNSDIGDFAHRTDYHIGWSVMYYFTDKPFPPVKPYILAGHCFD